MILECGCPGEFPAEWDRKDIDLGDYCIHRLPVPMLVHMPLAFEVYVQRQQRMIDGLGLHERWPGLVLTRTGMLRGTITRLLEDAQSLSRHVRTLPSPYHVRAVLHRGNVSTIRPALRELQMSLLDGGRMPKELYLCHLTCPRCSARRGGDQILLLRHWQPSAMLEKRRRA